MQEIQFLSGKLRYYSADSKDASIYVNIEDFYNQLMSNSRYYVKETMEKYSENIEHYGDEFYIPLKLLAEKLDNYVVQVSTYEKKPDDYRSYIIFNLRGGFNWLYELIVGDRPYNPFPEKNLAYLIGDAKLIDFDCDAMREVFEGQLAEANNEIKSINDILSSLQAEKNTLEKEFDSKSNELKELINKTVELQNSKRDLQVALDSAQDKIDELEEYKADREAKKTVRELFIDLFQHPVFLLIPLLSIIIVSAVDMGMVFSGKFESSFAAWAMSGVFASVVLVFTFNTKGRIAKLLAGGFALIELLINGVYFGWFPDNGLIVEACASIGVPLALVAYANLFANYTKHK